MTSAGFNSTEHFIGVHSAMTRPNPYGACARCGLSELERGGHSLGRGI